MATMLDERTTEESVLLSIFLRAKGLNAKDSNKELFPLYGGRCLSCKVFHKLVEKFS
jgi:hypothetical protein